VYVDRRLRQAIVDWAVPAIIAGVGLVNIATHQDTDAFPGPPAVHVAFLLSATTVLGLRRRFPLLAPVLAVAIAVGWGTRWPEQHQGSFEAFVIVVGAAYTIGAGERGPRLRWMTVGLAASFVIGQIVFHFLGGYIGDLVPTLTWMAGAWGVGVAIRSRSEQARRARQLAAQLEVTQEHRTAEAVEQERSRIARELHDVVAHGLSVIVVQAAAERRALAHGTTDADSTGTVLESVERAGREALVDLRRLLGLLRQVDEAPSLAPQPSLDQLDVLVAPLEDAGIDVTVHTEGSAEELPAGVGLTAYRIVQESLTNVLKHAHAQRVEVAIRHRPGRVEIDVLDDGGAAGREPAAPGSGNGLLGMRERVSIFGGTVTTGPHPEGGWAVRARLPIGAQILESA
jgi:signal transduction histidine kinase